jgi:threonine dehydratase
MGDGLRLPTAAEVDAARARIAGIARRTPLWPLEADTPGMRIHLKLETLQPLGSFKIRAAVNAVKSAIEVRGEAAVRAGVISASAGNFGLGIALAARRVGAPVTIVVPDGSARAKGEALEALGARVIRVPFDDWWAVLTARRFEGAQGVFFHPVAEAAVVAGNATIGTELIEDLDAFDAVIVPFGGGGLISGIGSVMRRERPGTRMLAVESAASQPAAAALAAGRPTAVKHDQSFVDGMGSGTVLEPMWPLVRETVDGALCVSFAEITAAIRLLAARHHVIAEGAGAAALAAALSGRAGGGDIVCVISGGNIDPDKLAMILEGREPF